MPIVQANEKKLIAARRRKQHSGRVRYPGKRIARTRENLQRLRVLRASPNAKPLVLAIDLGSSSTRSALFDSKGRPVPKTAANKNYSIQYADDGAAELSPLPLLKAVNECITATRRGTERRKITAVSISSFWHGLLGLNERWQPITPIYTWADSRSAGAARELRDQLSDKRVHARTGCRIHSSYWPAKLLWLGTTSPALFRRVQFWVSPIDWLLHHLCGSEETTSSIASATGLYNLRHSTWDQELCRAVNVRREQLRPIVPLLSTASKSIQTFRGPIFCLGDGAASNLGSGADRDGTVAINVGTSGAIRMIVSSSTLRTDFGLFRYILDRDRHVVGGAVSNAGNLRQWALRELRIPSKQEADRRMFERKAAAQDRLTAVPDWVAERAPAWNDQTSGAIHGFDQATTATEISRALATSVFYRLAAILDVLERNHRVKRVIVSGGTLRSPAVLRVFADGIGRDIEVARDREASLRGAAIFALENLGFETPKTLPGRVVKHNATLAAQHRQRRERQRAFERFCSGGL